MSTHSIYVRGEMRKTIWIPLLLIWSNEYVPGNELY